MPKKKRAKRTLRLDVKALLILKAIAENVRYHKAITGSEAVGFTMREIASFTGYSASNKLMLDLYKMCDEGSLILDQEPIKKTGKADCRNRFYTPDSWKQKAKQMKMFKEMA